MKTGIYIAIPFCRAKCSFCNFASGPARAEVYDAYLERLTRDIAAAEDFARERGCAWPDQADSLYLGGGTPSILSARQLDAVFASVRARFALAADAEITVECAPGTITDELASSLAANGVTRVSLGAQSFVEKELRAVGRRHSRAVVEADLECLRRAGVARFNIDLIAGLPRQTEEGWRESLAAVIASGVEHVSVYMLEIDEDSRLGREALRGGQRYGAAQLPDEELTVRLYELAADELAAAGVAQYEISNFARPGAESRHNLKYWLREPYLGFGLEAHSMLPMADDARRALRWGWPSEMELYRQADEPQTSTVDAGEALEEFFFLGLRLNRGVSLSEAASFFGEIDCDDLKKRIDELIGEKLLFVDAKERICLTARGRIFSNEVSERFLA